MARRAAQHPAGKVTEVFRSAAERQAAYDFLEHDHVSGEEAAQAMFTATAAAASSHERVFVIIDGSSLSLRDREGSDGVKDFGCIGTFSQRGRGIKVVSALALAPEGVPMGIASQVWWTRTQRVRHGKYRRVGERESIHWKTSVDTVRARFAEQAPATKVHFLADREADGTLFIKHLLRSGHEFTIRSNATRNAIVRGQRCKLRNLLERTDVIARTKVEVRATQKRAARTAALEIHAAQVPLVMRDRFVRQRTVVPLTVVWAHERGRSRRRGGLDWVLFTNTTVTSDLDALEVVRRYLHRWRVEDFHKTWKSGVCRIEQTQLRSKNAVVKWATILAAVAVRAEHLRQRARVEPTLAAAVELSSDELEALVLLKNDSSRSKRFRRRNLDLATAVRWIADLGGYVGSKGNGPPGATTIARGLEQVAFAARVLAAARSEKR